MSARPDPPQSSPEVGDRRDAGALDAAQSTVVAWGPASSGVVIGAPGTGKTRALVARAERLLARELSPDELLVLTPTRQTATGLRDRLAFVAGRATGGPLARSVASFAYQVVRAAAVHAGDDPPQLLTGGDQDRIIADLLAGDHEDALSGRDRWPSSLGPEVRASRSFRTELRALFAECDENAVTADDLADIARVRGSDVWSAAASFFREYRLVVRTMRSAHRDAAELLAAATRILDGTPRGEAGLPRLGPLARLRVVLVDDAQELTRGGVALLRALRERGVAIVAFGDPDIGSGAFRGARPELFAELCDLLGARAPGHGLVVLDEAHRSVPALQRLTRVVTQAIGATGRVEHRRPPGPVVADETHVGVVVAPSPFEEVDRIARIVREWHLLEEIPWGRIAVIAHDTRQVAELEAELAARDVPTRAAGVQRPLGREPIVRDLVGIVRLAMTDPDARSAEDVAAALLSPFGGLEAVGLRRLRARLRHAEFAEGGTRPASALLVEAIAEPLSLGLIDTREAQIAARLATTLANVDARSRRGATIHELLWEVWSAARSSTGAPLRHVWRETALGGGVLAPEVSHALDVLVALFDAAKRFVEREPSFDAEAADRFIRRILDSDVPEDSLTAPERAETVTLLTPAAALGTEFDAVVIAGVQDGVWPNVRLRGGLLETWRMTDEIQAWRHGGGRPPSPAGVLDRRRAALHDELRLFVRALSRARRHLVVTAVDDDDLGPSPLFEFLPDPDDDAVSFAPEHPLTLRGLVAHHRRELTSLAPPTSGVDLAAHRETRRRAAGQLVVLARAGVPGADPAQWFGLAAPSSHGPLRDPDRAPVPVSPSKMTTLADCPLDWAIRALGGDTRSASAGIGTILHAALETVPGGELAELRRVVDDRWGELDFEAPWISQKERAWADVLVERLSIYLARVHREGGRTVGSETVFRLAIELDAAEGADARVVAVPDREAEGPLSVPALPGRSALLSGAIDRVEAYPRGAGEDLDDASHEGERVVIVDLKTGRSEKRVSDAKVVDDPQLAAYQLAQAVGAIPGSEGLASAGARLVVLSQTLKSAPHYRLARQAPLDDETRGRFVESVRAAAHRMASAHFEAHVDAHCTTARFAVCTLHTVKAVSSS